MENEKGKILLWLSLFSCLSDLKELVLGVGFSSSKYLTPLLQIFYLTPTLCWPGKRAGGEQKIIKYWGTPAQFFFQSVDSHFQANSIKGENLPKIVQDGLASKVIIQAFNWHFPLPF